MPDHTVCTPIRGNVFLFWEDDRSRPIRLALAKAGYRVFSVGTALPEGIPIEQVSLSDWRTRVKEADAVIFPLPARQKDGTLSFSKEEITPGALFSCLSPGTVFLGGMLPDALLAEAGRYGIRACDYYRCEEVKYRNALLTAEGALAIAMAELPLTLSEIHAAVVGCGRIGSALCKDLRQFGASVTAFARRTASLIGPEADGCVPVLLDTPENRVLSPAGGATDAVYDIVFNTVPEPIFTREILSEYRRIFERTGRLPLFLDLSSSPGGFDKEAAKEFGIPIRYAPSLPAHYAPESAGKVLSHQILRLLTESLPERKEENP